MSQRTYTRHELSLLIVAWLISYPRQGPEDYALEHREKTSNYLLVQTFCLKTIDFYSDDFTQKFLDQTIRLGLNDLFQNSLNIHSNSKSGNNMDIFYCPNIESEHGPLLLDRTSHS